MADDSATNACSPADRAQHSLADFFLKIEASLNEAGANAVAAQQQAWVVAQAAQTTGIAALYALDIAAAGQSSAQELKKGSTGEAG